MFSWLHIHVLDDFLKFISEYKQILFIRPGFVNKKCYSRKTKV